MELTKKKAEDLLFKMHKVETIQGVCYMTIHEAKQCALIAVDEILTAIDWHQFEVPNEYIEFWEQVKQEINKL